MKNHTIVCGLGHVGYRIWELLLRLKEHVVIITDKTRDEWKDNVESKGVQIILGDASDDRKLIEAGVRDAKAIIVATDNDLVNVSVALDAKRLNPKINVVIRLFDQSLAQRLEQHLDVRRVLSTSLLSAPAFAAASLGDQIFSSFDVDGNRFTIGRSEKLGDKPFPKDSIVPIVDGLCIIDASLHFEKSNPIRKDASVHFADRFKSFFRTFSYSTWFIFAVLLGIVFISTLLFAHVLKLDAMSALYYVITTITTVGYGDINLRQAEPLVKLYGCFLMICGAAFIAALFGTVTNFFVQQRLEQFFGKRYAVDSDHIVVIGTGNISYRVVRELLSAEQKVILVSQDEKDEASQAVRELCPVIFGSLKTQDVLEKANAKRAKAVLAITEDDVSNLSIGLAAKELNPQARVALRVFNADLASKVKSILKIDSVLSTSAISAPAFVGAALFPDVLNALVADDRLIIFQHHKINGSSAWQGKKLRQIEQSEDIKFLFDRKSPGRFLKLADDHTIVVGDDLISVRIKQLSSLAQ